ncbi:hypothetical protein DITRI_Ditri08aG0070200 [Diplodiscus trichospermus]
MEKSKSIETSWLRLGDFNDILYNFEKKGRRLKDARKIKRFKEMVEESQLLDLQFKGVKFTSINRRNERLIKEKIDRVFCNVYWLEDFSRTQLVNLPIIGSDHGPIYIDLDYNEMKSPRMFKFEIMWTENEECKMVIKEGWEGQIKGSYAYRLVQKLKKYRRLLVE